MSFRNPSHTLTSTPSYTPIPSQSHPSSHTYPSATRPETPTQSISPIAKSLPAYSPATTTSSSSSSSSSSPSPIVLNRQTSHLANRSPISLRRRSILSPPAKRQHKQPSSSYPSSPSLNRVDSPPRISLGSSVNGYYNLSPPRVRELPPLRPPISIPHLPLPSMVFQSQSNYLSAKLDIQFESEGVVDMVGGPNTGSTYSLPGHIILSLPSLPAPLEGRVRELREVKLVVEGKSEFWDHEGRYTPMRIFSSTIDLLSCTSETQLIPSCDPSRPHSSRLQMTLPFDVRLPGWLPCTHNSDMTAIAYGCVVHAVVGWTTGSSLGPSSSSSSLSSSSSCSASAFADATIVHPQDPMGVIPFRHNLAAKSKSTFENLFSNQSLLPASTEKSSGRWSPFTVRRHRILPTIGSPVTEPTERHFTLRPEADSTSPIECVVSVPEFVDVNGEEKSLKVSLRIRARKDAIAPQHQHVAAASASSATVSTATSSEPIGEDTVGQLESVPMERSIKSKKDEDALTRMVELGMEVEETEWFSSAPSSSFVSAFPIPEEQPCRHSSQHRLLSPASTFSSASFGYEDRPFRGTRTRSCLLSEDGNQRNFFFADEGLGLSERWRKVNVVLPMPADMGKNSSRPKPEFNGPFERIKHALKIRVVCKGMGSSEDAQVVLLSTPIRFGTCPTTIPSDLPRAASLPAYVQLFHENGDLRECDPLPLYSESKATALSLAQQIPSTPAPDYTSLFGDRYPSSEACSSRSPSPLPISSFGERSASPSSQTSDDEPIDTDVEDSRPRAPVLTPRSMGVRKAVRTGAVVARAGRSTFA